MWGHCAAPSGGFRLPIPYFLQVAGEGVGTCSRYNLHRTGYTENDTQRIVDLQGVDLQSKINNKTEPKKS